MSQLNEAELMKYFEDTTGKNAIWRGQITKIYLRWKKRHNLLISKVKPSIPKKSLTKIQKVEKELTEKLSELEEAKLMKVFEDSTGRHAIWRGKITKIYLQWKNRQKIITLKEKPAKFKPESSKISKGLKKVKQIFVEPTIISPDLSKKKAQDVIEFEEIPEFEYVSEFDDIFDLELTPEIGLDTPEAKQPSAIKTSLLEDTISQALVRLKESFERHCPKCGGEMKQAFVILGPQRRMMVYQCGLCKFYLPR